MPRVEELHQLGMPCYKISSGDITFQPLLEAVAKTQKPVFLSTGMSYLAEVEQAWHIFLANQSTEVALLHCVAQYQLIMPR